ncbi:MAG: hypothetical protein CFE45_32975 [Burkholderiales bacterium PBB5]|nr:MAG: hypothetical protein CFE45_32975 [Burkholderiales bacterium PBB5]
MPTVVPKVVVPLGHRNDQRAAERFDMELPMKVADGVGGTTRDLSVNGLSFTSPQPYALGARIDVTIEYLLDGHNFPLRCEATVVRCEPCGLAYTVGARLALAFLE